MEISACLDSLLEANYAGLDFTLIQYDVWLDASWITALIGSKLVGTVGGFISVSPFHSWNLALALGPWN